MMFWIIFIIAFVVVQFFIYVWLSNTAEEEATKKLAPEKEQVNADQARLTKGIDSVMRRETEITELKAELSKKMNLADQTKAQAEAHMSHAQAIRQKAEEYVTELNKQLALVKKQLQHARHNVKRRKKQMTEQKQQKVTTPE